MNIKVHNNYNWNPNFTMNRWSLKRKSRKLRNFFLSIIHRLQNILLILLGLLISIILIPIWWLQLVVWNLHLVNLLRVVLFTMLGVILLPLLLAVSIVLTVIQTVWLRLQKRLEIIELTKHGGKQEISMILPKYISQGIKRDGLRELFNLWKR